ncbi:MAG: Ig-like domain-containing protein, partial [Candidatus Colwellbacteria bacterium]|nr:Ig-like domain-containing protein [Candidatus Colwellbacteria bacterium]
GAVSTTVSYDSATVVTLDVTDDFTAGDVVVISGLSVIGHTGASGAATMTFATDGADTYDTDDSTANITVADGAEDTLTAATVVPYDPVKDATSNYTINFTIPATGVIPPNGKITLAFPAGFDISAADIDSATGIDGTFAASAVGQDLTIERQNDGTNATAGAKVLNLTGIVNHATAADTYDVIINTTTADDELLATVTTDAFKILNAPAAISDLTCEASGQAGAIWLRWTTPVGASISYTAKHALAAIDDNTKFTAGTAITQSWAVGTRGSSVQQLVTGLNPNTRYYFSVKSTGFGDTLSAISAPTSTSCIAPAGVSATLDTTAPNTQITSPAGGSTVQAGQALVIKGTAIDSGGSSVQKIEVSLDGGTTWNDATVTDDDGTNVIWEYTWANAQAGSQTIKARATDWTSNIEDTPAEITVTISSSATTPAESGETTTPATGTTAEQLQAQLQTLRVQLLNLLQQLLVKLQTQLLANLQAQL